MKVFWVCLQKQGRFPQLIHADFIQDPKEALASARAYEGAKPEEILIGWWETETRKTGGVYSLTDPDVIEFMMAVGI